MKIWIAKTVEKLTSEMCPYWNDTIYSLGSHLGHWLPLKLNLPSKNILLSAYLEMVKADYKQYNLSAGKADRVIIKVQVYTL